MWKMAVVRNVAHDEYKSDRKSAPFYRIRSRAFRSTYEHIAKIYSYLILHATLPASHVDLSRLHLLASCSRRITVALEGSVLCKGAYRCNVWAVPDALTVESATS
jgi:hypothetical protein